MAELPELPEWTKSAGGREWRKWMRNRISGCRTRASKWAEKRHIAEKNLPTKEDWRNAIWDALRRCEGRAHYSHLPLKLEPGKHRNWDWPSLDHVSSPAVADVVLEVRLVNDMKTIMSEDEFRQMVGHLAVTLKTHPKELTKGWFCGRSFAIEEPPDTEPPLPSKAIKKRVKR